MCNTFVIVVNVENPRPLVVQNHVGECPVIRRPHEYDVTVGVGGSQDRRVVVVARVSAVEDRQRVDRGARRHQRHGESAAEGDDGVGGDR